LKENGDSIKASNIYFFFVAKIITSGYQAVIFHSFKLRWDKAIRRIWMHEPIFVTHSAHVIFFDLIIFWYLAKI
jgi:hypothetical protein